MKRLLLFACAAMYPASLLAQVGSTPQQSPFRDLETRMEVSLLAGYMSTGREPVGVAPQPGPYVGGRYEFAIGSLISTWGRLGMVASKRDIIDPTLPAATRVIGETNLTLMMVDAGFSFSLTGARSFHNFVPSVSLGLGMSTDLQSKDASGFAITPRIMGSMGAGVKWLAGNSWQVRLDVTNHLIGIRYPDSYLEPGTDGTRARTGDGSRYTSNAAITVGIARRFFR